MMDKPTVAFIIFMLLAIGTIIYGFGNDDGGPV